MAHKKYKVTMTRVYRTYFTVAAPSKAEALDMVVEKMGDEKYCEELEQMNVVEESYQAKLVHPPKKQKK